MTSRRFPHHDAVIALHGILTKTFAKAEPDSDITKYPASFSETFLDMARAVTEAGYLPPPKPGERRPTRAQDDEVVIPADLFDALLAELRHRTDDDPDLWAVTIAQAVEYQSEQRDRVWKTGGNPAPTQEFILADATPEHRRISNQRRALRRLESHARWAEKMRRYAESTRAAMEEQLEEEMRELRAENARLTAQVASLTGPTGPVLSEAAPDDFDMDCYLNDAPDLGIAVGELVTKYDIAVTNQEPRWQGGVYLRHIDDLERDIRIVGNHLNPWPEVAARLAQHRQWTEGPAGFETGVFCACGQDWPGREFQKATAHLAQVAGRA
ncbi:hypothetical protein ACWGJ9_11135 [Curtobacterium citreum]